MVLARVLSVAVVEMQHAYLPGIPGWNVFTVSFLSPAVPGCMSRR